MQLVLDTNGLVLKKRNNVFWVVHKNGRRMISPHKISSIAVVRDCLISTAAIRLAAKHGIPIFFFSASAKAEARLWSANFGSIVTIRKNQIKIAESPAATALIIDWFVLKTQNQIELLQYFSDLNPNPDKQINEIVRDLKERTNGMLELKNQKIADIRSRLLGHEGSIAKLYWQTVSEMLPADWQFAERSRRPAKDHFNAALNYLYGMLYNVVESGILAAGLDPYAGFFHVDEYNKPTFTFDMIESFRPWVDQLLTKTILESKPTKDCFVLNEKGIWLSKTGRKFFIPLFNDFFAQRINYNGKTLSRKNHIFRFAGLLAAKLKAGDWETGK